MCKEPGVAHIEHIVSAAWVRMIAAMLCIRAPKKRPTTPNPPAVTEATSEVAAAGVEDGKGVINQGEHSVCAYP